MADKLDLSVSDDGHSYYIGTVELPDGDYDEVCNKINALWYEWREEVPHPDADSEFINWLVEKHGWVESTGNFTHTIGE